MHYNILEDSDPVITDVMSWARNSPLRVNWYEIAVELVGYNEADAIEANHSGGGNKKCLRMSLNKWWKTTDPVDRNWQTIVNALEKIEQVALAENIIDKCSNTP